MSDQSRFKTTEDADHLGVDNLVEKHGEDAAANIASAALNKLTEKTRKVRKFVPSISFPKAEEGKKGIFGTSRGIFFKWTIKF